MVEMKKKAHEFPFFVRQAGLTYDEEGGAIKGYMDKASADEDVVDRTRRAREMGLRATYEVVDARL